MSGIPWTSIANAGGWLATGGIFTGFWNWLSHRRKQTLGDAQATSATAIQVLHGEIERLRDDLAKLRADFDLEKQEKHALRERLYVMQVNEVIYKTEINLLLKDAGKAERYQLRVDYEGAAGVPDSKNA